MASVAASVARLTHPRSQTGRGRPAALPSRFRSGATVRPATTETKIGVGTPAFCRGRPGSRDRCRRGSKRSASYAHGRTSAEPAGRRRTRSRRRRCRSAAACTRGAGRTRLSWSDGIDDRDVPTPPTDGAASADDHAGWCRRRADASAITSGSDLRKPRRDDAAALRPHRDDRRHAEPETTADAIRPCPRDRPRAGARTAA